MKLYTPIAVLAFLLGLVVGMQTCNCLHKPCYTNVRIKDSTIIHQDTILVFSDAHSEIQVPQLMSEVKTKVVHDSIPVYITRDSFVLQSIDTARIIADYIAFRNYEEPFYLGLDTIKVNTIVQGNNLIGQSVKLSKANLLIKQTLIPKPHNLLYFSTSMYYYKGELALGAGPMIILKNKVAVEAGAGYTDKGTRFYYLSYKTPLIK